MSKKIAYIPLDKIDKIELYVNSSRKSLDTIKKEKNFDYAINGGLYDMRTFKPNCHLKVNGNILAKDKYGYWGYSWDKNDFSMTTIPNKNKQNYICCCDMINKNDGILKKLTYNPEQGGSRYRTAIGTKENNICLFACNENITPEKLRDYVANQGWDTAVMLDCGGSTQCSFKGDKIYSSRNVHNYILVYLKKENDLPPKKYNPYPIPTRALKRGYTGNDVKWLQYQLNNVFNSFLSIDGSFGPACYKEVCNFQRKYIAPVDGSVGPATRSKLIELGK